MLRPDGRAAEQSRDRASKAKAGEGGMVSTLDHDSCKHACADCADGGWMLYYSQGGGRVCAGGRKRREQWC